LKKYKIRINQDKLNELKKQLQPGRSWWALVGIIFFFFLPELIAYIWGDEIVKYFTNLENSTTDSMYRFLYKQLKGLGENSLFNLSLGVIFLVWFFKVRE